MKKTTKKMAMAFLAILTGAFLLMPGVSALAAPPPYILTIHVPVDDVKSVQVVDDTHVFAHSGIATIDAYAPNGDTHFNRRTLVGIYDDLYTSDPSSGGTLQIGAIASMPVFHSATEATVTIDTSVLTAGTYWLRFITRLPGGKWEVAEGVLVVH